LCSKREFGPKGKKIKLGKERVPPKNLPGNCKKRTTKRFKLTKRGFKFPDLCFKKPSLSLCFPTRGLRENPQFYPTFLKKPNQGSQKRFPKANSKRRSVCSSPLIPQELGNFAQAKWLRKWKGVLTRNKFKWEAQNSEWNYPAPRFALV